eukprot:1149155-Pelagomonas_calceolata.AAC.3
MWNSEIRQSINWHASSKSFGTAISTRHTLSQGSKSVATSNWGSNTKQKILQNPDPAAFIKERRGLTGGEEGLEKLQLCRLQTRVALAALMVYVHVISDNHTNKLGGIRVVGEFPDGFFP